jgi:PAS domain S-box-containing protein
LEELVLGRMDWPVSRIMNSALLTCPPQMPLSEAAALMEEQRCSSILITSDQGTVKGIWTEHDALSVDLDDAERMAAPISSVMSSPVHSVPLTATLEDLVMGFKGRGIRHFVVLDGNKPAGVVSQTDVIRHQGIHAYLTLRDVGSLVQKAPVLVQAERPVSEVAHLLRKGRSEAAVVLFDGVADGILTERDVLRMIASRAAARKAGDVCTRPLVCALATQPLVQAHDLMERLRIRHLAIKDEVGAVTAVLSFSDILAAIELDYTRYLQAVLTRQKEALRLGEVRQQKILESTQEGFLEIDTNQIIVRVNAALCALLGLKNEDLVGRPVSAICNDESQQRLSHQIALIPQQEQRSYELVLRHRKGYGVPVAVKATTLRGTDGTVTGSFALLSDMTAQYQQQAEMAGMVEQVSQSNAELEAFAYVISHDLQEPLRMIASYMRLIERRYPEKLDDEGREFISYAVDGAKRMQSMITDLLEYSRVHRQGHSFSPCDTEQCLHGALRNLLPRLSESGGVVDADVLPTVYADGPQVIRLFQCLIDNAITFRDPQRPPRIRIGARRGENPHEWVFWVQDNGIGIEAQFNERIFQMFQRLHARGHLGGNGIGLAVCKRIVERHHGRIWLESEIGKGTIFYFTLPEYVPADDGALCAADSH